MPQRNGVQWRYDSQMNSALPRIFAPDADPHDLESVASERLSPIANT